MGTGMSMQVEKVLQDVWGYDSFRPYQKEAMQAVLVERDSVVVLPTGGGKSLCYQVPALCFEGMAVVVSPLISLMKDQVDALAANGIAAAYLNSTLSPEELRTVINDVRNGNIKLLYVAPERLTIESTLSLLAEIKLSFIAIDEAHCISMWGHDFRPHYREMKILREAFPDIALHAYTATATEQVRLDIAKQLGLRQPEMLVGSFDRPNLNFSVTQRADRLRQIGDILQRHKNESGIIYCITRKMVDDISGALNALGHKALPYHAGLSDETRRDNQESFIQDDTEIIVATIAFGMGIDKPNVRFVIHAGLPKSLENYQQESGRAGRDGLEAECHLLYSAADANTWERIFSDLPQEAKETSLASVNAMLTYCHCFTCRHKQLVGHFGQTLEEDCQQNCDVCRGGFKYVDDPLVLGQKILSSVHRQQERYGASYTALVLKGSKDKKVLANKHDQLSTYGLLKEHSVKTIGHWINQLLAEGFLVKTTADYPLLQITPAGRELLKGNRTPQLVQLDEARDASSSEPQATWEGVDRGLYEELRLLRREIAQSKNMQPYMVFDDVTLRTFARHRPPGEAEILRMRGVGLKKRDDFGAQFLKVIVDYSNVHELSLDVMLLPEKKIKSTTSLTASAALSFPLFAEGLTIKEVAKKIDRAHSTVSGYLSQYIQHHNVCNASIWVEENRIERIEQAIAAVGADRLRPIFDELEETIDYDSIRIVVACYHQREQSTAE